MAITLPRTANGGTPARSPSPAPNPPPTAIPAPPSTLNRPPVRTAAPAPAQESLSQGSSETFGTAQQEMIKILKRSQERGSSDVIITVGLPPMFRVSGSLQKDKFPVLNPDMTKKLVYSLLRQDQIGEFESRMELDLSVTVPRVARFRVNVYRQKKFVGAAFRSITEEIPGFNALGLSKAVETLALLPRGLVLITGPTGSGKSSTLAAMVDLINEKTSGHIITVEDPIEYVHKHKNCIVDQRELKTDTESFPLALRHVLRQDPDTILVGEMRDLETIAAAISAAETGHLVLSTLHTQDSAQTVDRIVDAFPAYAQEQIRAQLSTTLRGILSQQLLPKKTGGRVAAREILLVTPAIANLIREGKTYQIHSAIQTGQKLGMVTMDQSLNELYERGIISFEDAVSKAIYPENIKPIL
jgi:twitching motility protein PilT